MTNWRICFCSIRRASCGVSGFSSNFVFRQGSKRRFSRFDGNHRTVSGFQIFQSFFSSRFVSSHGSRNVFEFFNRSIRTCFVDGANFQLFRIFQQLLFFGCYFFQSEAIDCLRNWIACVFHRQPNHWQHVSNDQNHVLSHLSPSHRTHTAQERANQDTCQASENTHFKSQAGQTCCNQTHAVNLRHNVCE